jgi:hypothetical protein
MRGFRLAVLLATVVALGGCRSSALQKDQDRFRQTILDSYTNQIMDNLIRASNAMPIVQVDFTNITGTVTDVGSVGTSPSTTTTDDTQLTFAALKKLTQRVTERMFANTAAWNLNASRQQQLSATGVPVIDKPEIYRAYLDFLSKPGSLVRDCNPPPPELAHLVRKVGETYFYVPTSYRKEFFELVLKTTVMRGEPAVPSETFKSKVEKAVVKPPAPGDTGLRNTVHELTLTLAKPIPNDSGTLKFSKDPTTPIVLQIAKHPGPPDAPTDTLNIAYDEAGTKLKPEEMVAALVGAPEVEILLVHHRPQVATTDEILKSIFTQVQLNRLDNLRLLIPR